MVKVNFPQWFIDDIHNLEDRNLAICSDLDTSKTIQFQCKQGHVYEQKVSNHIDLKTLQPRYGCPICKQLHMNVCRSEKCKQKRVYPQWFIDELVKQEDKERAISGDLVTTEKVDFKCVTCGEIYAQRISHHINLSTQEPVQKCPYCRYLNIPRQKHISTKRVPKLKVEKTKQSLPDMLEGKQYGQLTVIRRVDDHVSESGRKYKQYLCRCSCGNEVTVFRDNLVGGKTTKCKDCKTKVLVEASRKRGDKSDPPIGSVYGHLTILEKFYHIDSRGVNTQFYRCQCDCGNITEVAKHSILEGLTKSCGCEGSRNKLRDKRIEIGEKTDPQIGQRFGNLTVLQIIPPPEGGEKNIECKCDCGNIITIRKPALLNGKNKTCGHCPNQYPQWFIDRIVDEDIKNKAIDGTLNTQNPILISCANCNTPTLVHPHNILTLNGQIQKRIGLCNECSHHTSTEELEIRDFLLSLGVPVEEIGQNKLGVIPNRELDFYLSKYKLAIEFNGSYYHAEDRKPKNYHQDKFKLCEQKGIHLISIFEKDWIEQKDKVKSVLKACIIQPTRLYARTLSVKEIEYSIAKEFFSTYHIQGSSQHGSINFGLVDQSNKLLSVMSFGKKRYSSNEGEYEIHRYCTIPDYAVIGGASKLLHAFEVKYKPKELLTYSDNDYFTGNVYSQLGFIFEKYTDPDYYWYSTHVSFQRNQTLLSKLREKYPELYQKATDTKASNKENYIMESLGAIKVYRSGSKRWIKRYS